MFDLGSSHALFVITAIRDRAFVEPILRDNSFTQTLEAHVLRSLAKAPTLPSSLTVQSLG